MKKILFYTGILAGFCGLMLTSCQRDLLESTPTNVLTDAAILNDSILADAYVVGRYGGVQLHGNECCTGSGITGFGRGFEYALLSSVSDESIHVNNDGTWVVVKGELAADNTGWMSTIWGRSYRSIRECNYALANLDKVPMSQGLKDKLKAEVRFIRAYRYHDLIRQFGDVPLVGDKVYGLTDTDYDALYNRRPVQECIAYAVQELDAAASLLPRKGSNDVPGRATQGAALALKARLLLYAASPLYTNGANDVAKWQTAAGAAKDVMGLGYSLYQGGYRRLFLTPNTSEDIFERLYSPTNSHVELERSKGPNGYGGWSADVPLQQFVDDFETKEGKAITDPTSGYDPQNPYVDRDPRFYDIVLFNGAMHRGRAYETFLPGGKDSKDGNEPWNTSKTGYNLLKFIDENKPVQNPNQTGTQPWKYIRYGEVLLNYAEAQNEAVGPDASVYEAVNQIRRRAGMPDLPMGLSQSDMRQRIRSERRIELSFEEHRFYDVRRWKIAAETENVPAYGINITKQANGTFKYERMIGLDGRKFEEKHYWMPIPISEIQASGGKLKQNPGY
jgi:starch-binding outer membrane protein, SusD/RagB family